LSIGERTVRRILLLGAACATVAIVTRIVTDQSRRLSACEASSVRTKTQRTLVGTRFDAGKLLPGLLREISTARSQPLALLVLGQGECIACMAEVARWASAARQSDMVRLAVVLAGDHGEISTLLDHEFPSSLLVVPDRESRLLRGLGLSEVGTLRLLVVEDRIALLASGPDEGPVGFIEALQFLVRHDRVVGAS